MKSQGTSKEPKLIQCTIGTKGNQKERKPFSLTLRKVIVTHVNLLLHLEYCNTHHGQLPLGHSFSCVKDNATYKAAFLSQQVSKIQKYLVLDLDQALLILRPFLKISDEKSTDHKFYLFKSLSNQTGFSFCSFLIVNYYIYANVPYLY